MNDANLDTIRTASRDAAHNTLIGALIAVAWAPEHDWTSSQRLERIRELLAAYAARSDQREILDSSTEPLPVMPPHALDTVTFYEGGVVLWQLWRRKSERGALRRCGVIRETTKEGALAKALRICGRDSGVEVTRL